MANKKFKELLCEIINFECELCHKYFDINTLEIHRIKRGNTGGKYEHRNCMVLCDGCHKRLHENEFR